MKTHLLVSIITKDSTYEVFLPLPYYYYYYYALSPPTWTRQLKLDRIHHPTSPSPSAREADFTIGRTKPVPSMTTSTTAAATTTT